MEERPNHPFNFPIENENVEETFDMLYRERGLCDPALLQELEYILGVWIFRRAGDGVKNRL